MNYELVKKLYKAGFPMIEHDTDGINKDYPTYITLSELIEACGKKYTENSITYEFSLLFSMDKWFAGYSDAEFKRPELYDGQGLTPEEAVANLYLELKK